MQLEPSVAPVALFKVRLANVFATLPPIVGAEPVIETVLVPGVNVRLLVQLPPTVMVLAPAVSTPLFSILPDIGRANPEVDSVPAVIVRLETEEVLFAFSVMVAPVLLIVIGAVNEAGHSLPVVTAAVLVPKLA